MHRIASSPLVRPFESDEEKTNVRLIYFISVEDKETEVDYFKRLVGYQRSKGYDVPFTLQLLSPEKEGLNSPQAVYARLDWCKRMRPQKIKLGDLSPSWFMKKYGRKLDRYFEPNVRVSEEKRQQFREDLNLLGFTYKFLNDVRKFGKTDDNQNPTDIFAMVIDRDKLTHTDRNELIRIAEDCERQGFRFCLSNPCLELWLYLHLADDVCVSDDKRKKMLANEKEEGSARTYVAGLLAERCEAINKHHHVKNISERDFGVYYGPNIQTAIDRAKKLTTKMPALLDQVGTNVGELVEDMLTHCFRRKGAAQ